MPISNSSPLIHLSRLTKIGYVRKVFPSLVIPATVRTEAIEKGKSEGYRDALGLEKLENEGWLRTVKLSSASSMKTARELASELGKGEAEAIALALERKDRLLMDDQKGRQIANLYGVETTTTLGLLLELLIEGVLSKEDYRRNVKNYCSQGWITTEVVHEFLERGEKFERADIIRYP